MNLKPLQAGERFIGKQQGSRRFLFQVFQVSAVTGKFFTDAACFPVGGIFFQIVAEDALPVGFDGVMNRMPVPVHDGIGAGSEMTESL